MLFVSVQAINTWQNVSLAPHFSKVDVPGCKTTKTRNTCNYPDFNSFDHQAYTFTVCGVLFKSTHLRLSSLGGHIKRILVKLTSGTKTVTRRRTNDLREDV